MLASLLPGLRDLRAPLTAGYLLLIASYLAFHQEILAMAKAQHDVLQPLQAMVGPPGLLAAVTLTAYLVGVLWLGALAGASQLWRLRLWRLRLWRLRPRSGWSPRRVGWLGALAAASGLWGRLVPRSGPGAEKRVIRTAEESSARDAYWCERTLYASSVSRRTRRNVLALCSMCRRWCGVGSSAPTGWAVFRTSLRYRKMLCNCLPPKWSATCLLPVLLTTSRSYSTR